MMYGLQSYVATPIFGIIEGVTQGDLGVELQLISLASLYLGEYHASLAFRPFTFLLWAEGPQKEGRGSATPD